MSERSTMAAIRRRKMLQKGQEALIGYLAGYPWQLFGTFTFQHKVSLEDARSRFAEFRRRLGVEYRSPICCFSSLEHRTALRDVHSINPHFHALMTCTASLDAGRVKELWHEFGGQAKYTAEVEAFDNDRAEKGIGYVAKNGFNDDGEFDIVNGGLFAPRLPRDWARNKRTRRALRRHLARLEKQNQV